MPLRSRVKRLEREAGIQGADENGMTAADHKVRNGFASALDCEPEFLGPNPGVVVIDESGNEVLKPSRKRWRDFRHIDYLNDWGEARPIGEVDCVAMED